MSAEDALGALIPVPLCGQRCIMIEATRTAAALALLPAYESEWVAAAANALGPAHTDLFPVYPAFKLTCATLAQGPLTGCHTPVHISVCPTIRRCGGIGVSHGRRGRRGRRRQRRRRSAQMANPTRWPICPYGQSGQMTNLPGLLICPDGQAGQMANLPRWPIRPDAQSAQMANPA